MRSSRIISAIDTHTEGMPTRVVTGGVGTVPGATMPERRIHFIEHLDGLRKLLVNEPRGHASMSGAILQPATTPDGHYGVLYIEVSGLLPMCGHGTMGVATALVEAGMVPVTAPVTEIRLDTPAGRVVASVATPDGHAESVTLRNVPSYCDALDLTVDVLGYGPIGYDIAYGGNFYAIVDPTAVGLPFDRSRKDELIAAGLAIMAAINDQRRPQHAEDPRITGCKHVLFLDPTSTGDVTRNCMAIHPGWIDRSPCGTGTSALLARQIARGLLADDAVLHNSSILGTTFHARAAEKTTVGGRPAVIPELTGRAWVTGTANYLLDPTDPFPEGFVF